MTNPNRAGEPNGQLEPCHDSILARWARVRTSFEGFHRYPAAPTAVRFLRNLHRHLFFVTVWVEQFDDERDVEYILFKRWLDRQVADAPFPEIASCEWMARHLGGLVQATYPGRRVRVEVAEDDENGALLEFAARGGGRARHQPAGNALAD